MTWQGAPDEALASLFGSDGAFNYGVYRSAALDGLLDEARAAAGPGARAPDPDPHRAAPGRRSGGDLSLRYDVPALVAGRVRGLAAVGDRFDFRRAWLE